MKQRIFITLLFTLILYTSAKLIEDNDLLYELLENSFAHEYFLDEYQSFKRRDILLSEKPQRDFQDDMLNTHNILRQRHCVLPLILDDKLCKNAQAYAEYLANEDNKLVHSERKNPLGENLYSTTASKPITNPDGDKVTRSWYNEIVDYNFDKPGFSVNTAHFTQVVWKDTKKLGIGIAFARGGRKMYVVAQYSPSGNYRHAFNTNVFPAKC